MILQTSVFGIMFVITIFMAVTYSKVYRQVVNTADIPPPSLSRQNKNVLKQKSQHQATKTFQVGPRIQDFRFGVLDLGTHCFSGTWTPLHTMDVDVFSKYFSILAWIVMRNALAQNETSKFPFSIRFGEFRWQISLCNRKIIN